MKALAGIFLLVAGCSRPTEVRLRLSLDANAPVPDAITVSLFDRFGGIAYDVPLAARLPGDLVILVSSDAEMLRAVASGLSAGQVVVGAASAVAVVPDQESTLALTLSATMLIDSDGDGIPDVLDDCPTVPDPEQNNPDGCNASPGGAPDLGTAHPAADAATAHDLAPPLVAASCGDGVVQSGEACDDGAGNSDDPAAPASCTSLCQKRASCGSVSGASAAQIDPATGHCYVAWPGPLNWATAARHCESRGGHLAVVTSAAESALVQAVAGAFDRWIGLKVDHGQAVRDHWVNGEAVSYSDWAAGEPNDGGDSGYIERCGVFDSLRAAWDDRPCGYAATGLLPYSYPYGLGYVCENECGNGVVEPGEGCDDSGPGCTATCQSVRPCTEAGGMASPVNGHCYFALSTPLAFSDALAACPSGTHLATLDEAAESEAGALAVGGSDAWIALTAAVTQGDYAWTNGGDVFEPTRYHGFANPDPDGATAPPYCARITPLDTWRDRECAQLYVPLCERE